MQVRKAVITAAAPAQHRLPLQQLVDQQGDDKTVLQLIVEETIASGVEEICVVIQPGDEPAYQAAAGNHLGSLQFVQQPQPRGYADAIFRASRSPATNHSCISSGTTFTSVLPRCRAHGS